MSREAVRSREETGEGLCLKYADKIPGLPRFLADRHAECTDLNFMKQSHTWILLACLVVVMAWVIRKPVIVTSADAKTGAAIHDSRSHETSAGKTARKSSHRPGDSEFERKEEIGKSRH
jgi:hypothetical protein